MSPRPREGAPELAADASVSCGRSPGSRLVHEWRARGASNVDSHAAACRRSQVIGDPAPRCHEIEWLLCGLPDRNRSSELMMPVSLRSLATLPARSGPSRSSAWPLTDGDPAAYSLDGAHAEQLSPDDRGRVPVMKIAGGESASRRCHRKSASIRSAWSVRRLCTAGRANTRPMTARA